ncbi:gp175 [Sphingomonas phage PAU]|uniref:gp175 n=1 Tax=Sphingomonas phage PAU TaxID=1150991 RepID=UPI00025732FB|nr:gp175 [Sphingomonas phage PAU]AFF28173.1 gp175 [Sphingomonas phage PAU]
MTEQFPEHIIESQIKISHSDLSIDMDYDTLIDEYDKTEFLEYLKEVLPRLINNLPERKGKVQPEIQVCSNFFIECKKKFPGITAMIIFDELTEVLEISPELLLANLAKPIKNQLIIELKRKISLDKYNKKVQKEFIERNGAIQPTFSSRFHNQTF